MLASGLRVRVGVRVRLTARIRVRVRLAARLWLGSGAEFGLGRGLAQLSARRGAAGEVRGEDGGHEGLEAIEARRLQHEQPHLRRNTGLGLGLGWGRGWVEVGRGGGGDCG